MAKGLPKKLLEVLACPKCKGALDYKKKENRLNCNKCLLSFKIVDGIPVMLLDEAEKLK